MFKNLTSFSYKRNWKEAIGFYLSYLLLALLLGGIAGAFRDAQLGSAAQYDSFMQAYTQLVPIGQMISIIYSLAVAILVLVKRRLYKNFGYILLSLISGILGIFGSIAGLIIPAIMTTKSLTETSGEHSA